MDESKRILVAIRIRPPNAAEKFDVISVRKVDFTSLAVINDDFHTSAADSNNTPFSFDAVFDDSDDQRTVYEDGCLGMVDAALDGHFVTILAYGQTGSGKTHTILGAPARPNGDLVEQSGMFLRVFSDLFTYKQSMRTRMQVIIGLSAVELYVDDIFDLLGDKAKVRLRESATDAVLCGTKYVEVRSIAEVARFFAVANGARSVTATKMNAESSRSHALFFIDVFQIPVDPDLPNVNMNIDELINADGQVKPIKNMVYSRVSLVDLAGSERTKKSGVEGQALAEANAINKSLSTLGTVINALYTKKAHVPFRDHKLTSILRPAFLDEKARVLLVGQVSPASTNCPESVMTLKFCDRLKGLRAEAVSFTENTELVQSLATASRLAAELAADVTLSCERAMYRPTVPRFRVGRLVHMPADAMSFCLAEAVSRSKAALGRLAADTEAALEGTRQRLQDTVVKATVERLEKLDATVTQLSRDVAAARADAESTIAAQTAAADAKLTQAKKAKKGRVQAVDKITGGQAESAALDEELETINTDLLVADRAKKNTSGTLSQDPNWIAEEDTWQQQEGTHCIVTDFHTLWRPLGKTHTDFVTTLGQCIEATIAVKQSKAKKASASKVEATSSSVLGTLPADIVRYALDRAVDISLGLIDDTDRIEWFDVYGASTKLVNWELWDKPLCTIPNTERFPGPSLEIGAIPEVTQLSDDELDASSTRASGAGSPQESPPALSSTPAATSASSSKPLEITHAQAVKNAREKRQLVKQQGGNSISRQIETQEANTHYLMTVYDSPTLVQDVSRFLGAGTLMLKHGRHGAPHRKKVFIEISRGAREVVWVDPEPAEADAKQPPPRSSIPVSQISKIVLGAYSKVFKRHPSTPQDKEFYLSFTLHTKDKSRTLDLVADTLVDFEAWVLGLSHMVQVDPVWGGSLSIPQSQLAGLDLKTREVAMCEKENILPATYLLIRKKILEQRSEAQRHIKIFNNDLGQAFESMGGIHAPQLNSKGAAYMTKGELRYYTNPWNIDIFRVCRLWQLFRDMDLIFDQSYLPATSFGVTART